MAGPNSTEIYGFIGWLASFAGLIMFALWSFIPDPILKSWGVDYYPSKYWAVALPAYLCMLIVFLQVAYQGLNIFYCKPYQSFYTTEDELTRRGYAESTGIPEVTDIPINVVNRVLYEYPKHKANNIK